MQDKYDGHLSADVLNSPMSNHERAALDAVFADMAALPPTPTTVPDADQPMHVTAQAIREENAAASANAPAIGAYAASKWGAVVRETNVRRKQADSVERINEELGAVRMLNYLNGRVLRVDGPIDLGAFHHIVADAMEKHALIARGEIQ